MKVIGIDETGKGNYFYLLCGITIDSDYLINFSYSISAFERKNGLSDLKDLKKPIKRKQDLLQELSNILEFYDVKIISVVLGDNTLKSIDECFKGKHKEFMRRYEPLKYLIERFYKHLENKNETGHVIFDNLDNETRKLFKNGFNHLITEKKFQMAFRSKYDFEKLILPSICFSDDTDHCVLQVADLVGYALKNALEVGLSKESFNNLNPDSLRKYLNYLDIYWPLFEKNPFNGRVKGYGIKMWNYNLYNAVNEIISNEEVAGVVIND